MMEVKHKTEDLDELMRIVNKCTGVDILEKRRKHKIVKARMIFSKIARDYGESLVNIGKFLGGKHHATVIHSIKMMEGVITLDDHSLVNYSVCRDLFYANREATVVINETQIRKELFSMRKRVEDLVMENQRLKNKLDKRLRLNDIIMMVDDRTPKGEEEFIFRKVNAMFNGINWKS